MLDSPYKIPGTEVFSPHPVQLTPAEIRLIHSLERYFDPENIFADCYFPKPDLSTGSNYSSHTPARTVQNANLTQIDCLALHEQGIFVFESKDYSGWIYGYGNQRYWTATLNFGKEKHQFYNPVKQNQLHISALQSCLPQAMPIFSIIVFGQNTTMKNISNLPESCHVCTQPTLRTLLSRLTTTNQASQPTPSLATDPLSPALIDTIRDSIKRSRITPDLLTRQNHIAESHNAQKFHHF